MAPQLTTTVGWPTAGDRQGRVRAGLSLLLDRPAGPVAQTGWRPPGAPWSCDLNAAATSPGDLLRAGASAWWLSCCSALRLPACSPGASLAFQSTQIGYLVHPVGAQRCPLGGLGDRTSHAPGLRGGPTSGAAPLRIIKSFFRAVFCGIPSSIGIAPTLEPSQPCGIGSDSAGTKPPLQVRDPIVRVRVGVRSWGRGVGVAA